MNIIYTLITITLFVVIILIKKSEEKLNIFKQMIITTILFSCYNMLVCYIFSLMKLPITLITLSIANLMILIIGLIKLIKDKQIQHYFVDKKDIIYIFLVLIVILPIAYKQYGNVDSIKYYTTDARVHYNASKLFYNYETLLINTNEYQGFMPFTYANEGIIYKLIAPIIGEFNLYKVFIVSDILICATSMILFYLLLKDKADSWIKYIIICIACVIFVLGYPLNSMLTGFHYLQVGVNLILTTMLVMNISKLDKRYKTIYMFLINLGVIFSYNIFAPLVYMTEFIYLFYSNYKENKRVINKQLIIDIILTLFMPGVLAVCYFILPVTSSGGNPTQGIDGEGYIYRNMWSTIILFVPFTLYYLIQKAKERKIDFSLIFITGLILNTIIFFALYKINKISSYYFYKMYYIIWPIIIYMSTSGLIKFYNKKLLNKFIAIILLIIYIATMMLFIKEIKYFFNKAYYEKDEENITTIMGIFNVNKTLLEMPKLLTADEIDSLEYVENNIDSQKTLFILIPRQEDWKQIMLYKSNPHGTEFRKIDEEIEKWNNGEYEHIVLFLNRNTYKVNKDKIVLEGTKKIYSNNEVQIYKKGE